VFSDAGFVGLRLSGDFEVTAVDCLVGVRLIVAAGLEGCFGEPACFLIGLVALVLIGSLVGIAEMNFAYDFWLILVRFSGISSFFVGL